MFLAFIKTFSLLHLVAFPFFQIYLLQVIANALGKSMICVNYAEIESKFVGETPKNIKEAFQFAEEK